MSSDTYKLKYTGSEVDKRLEYAGESPDWAEQDASKPTFIKNKPQVDNVYNPTSSNAQSGTAVAQAVADAESTAREAKETAEGKIDKVNSAIQSHVAVFNSQGGVVDSGKKIGSIGEVEDVYVGSNEVEPVNGRLTFDFLPYQTTLPSQANTKGLKIVVLPESQEPATKLNGYIYFIYEDNGA